MRTEGQIRQQLKQVLYRHLQKQLRSAFKRQSTSCKHNQAVPFAGLGVGVGLCFYLKGGTDPTQTELAPELPSLAVCDERLALKGGCRSLTCPYYTPRKAKDAIKAEFRKLIQSQDRGRIAAEYPDVAALLWVLDNQDVTEEIKSAEAEVDKAEPEGAVSWRPEG